MDGATTIWSAHVRAVSEPFPRQSIIDTHGKLLFTGLPAQLSFSYLDLFAHASLGTDSLGETHRPA